MQFAEDRGRPTYKVVKDPDMILDETHKTYPSCTFDMAETQQVDPAAIVADDAVSVDGLNMEAYLTIARQRILTLPLERFVVSMAIQNYGSFRLTVCRISSLLPQVSLARF